MKTHLIWASGGVAQHDWQLLRPIEQSETTMERPGAWQPIPRAVLVTLAKAHWKKNTNSEQNVSVMKSLPKTLKKRVNSWIMILLLQRLFLYFASFLVHYELITWQILMTLTCMDMKHNIFGQSKKMALKNRYLHIKRNLTSGHDVKNILLLTKFIFPVSLWTTSLSADNVLLLLLLSLLVKVVD